MQVEAARFELRQYHDAAQTAVDAVRQREVDDAVQPAEGHGGLCAITRERLEARALAAGKYESQNVVHAQLLEFAGAQRATIFVWRDYAVT
jgi:hypothetical protein